MERALICITSCWIHFHRMSFAKILWHYDDVIIGATASQITSLTIVYSTVYSDTDQRIHQSSTSLAFVWRIHRGPVNSPHIWPVTRKLFPFHDVIMGKPDVLTDSDLATPQGVIYLYYIGLGITCWQWAITWSNSILSLMIRQASDVTQ